jgi:hypothetical protein
MHWVTVKRIATVCAATLLLAGCGSHKPGNGGNGNPHKPGTDQQIHLVWTNATDGWRVKLGNGSEQKPADYHTPLALDVGPTKFTVDIQGPTAASFKDPGGLDVWVGSKSSPQTGINSTQVLGPIVTKGGKQLIFYDLNQGAPVTLNYQLNFDSGPPADPIIDNGGSSRD